MNKVTLYPQHLEKIADVVSAHIIVTAITIEQSGGSGFGKVITMSWNEYIKDYHTKMTVKIDDGENW
jgi:hypothetical protein